MKNERVITARAFAATAHAGQLRKYGDREPYIIHPYRVSVAVADLTRDEDMEIAGLLHDVAEDTDYTLDDIEKMFGPRVRMLVDDVTDKTKLSDGNRAARKAMEKDRLSKSHPDSKTLKMFDIEDNLSDIEVENPQFAPTYFAEKRDLMEVLKDGHPAIYHRVMAQIETFFAKQALAA